MRFEFILNYIEYVVAFAFFIISLRLLKRNVTPGYMKALLVYSFTLIILVIASFYSLSFSIEYIRHLHKIIEFSLLVHYAVISYVLIKMTQFTEYSRWMVFLSILFGISIIFILIVRIEEPDNYKSFFFANLALIILCGIYFFSIIKREDPGDLKKEPGFWIVSGVLLGMGFDLPIFGFWDIISTFLGNEYILFNSSFSLIGFIIMYSLFIKAVLCTKTSK